MEYFFPCLKEITLHIDYNYTYEILDEIAVYSYQAITDPNARDKLTVEYAKDLLHPNQQLNKIYNHSSFVILTLTTPLNMISRKPSILTLCLKSKNFTVAGLDELKRLVSEHPFIVELSLCGYVLTIWFRKPL